MSDQKTISEEIDCLKIEMFEAKKIISELVKENSYLKIQIRIERERSHFCVNKIGILRAACEALGFEFSDNDSWSLPHASISIKKGE